MWGISICLGLLSLLGRRRGSRGTARRVPFLQAAFRCVQRQSRVCSESAVNNYLTALRSLQHFLSEGGLQGTSLTRQMVEQYDQWLAGRGVSANTRSCYLRSLRSIYNKVRGNGRACRRVDVFSGVFTGNMPTPKRSVTLDSVRRICLGRDSSGGCGRLAADVFLFSIYAMGMPFADVAFLRWQDIRAGYIVYHRRKTGAEVRVRLEPCMLDIMRRWRGRNGDLVFPLVPHDTPRELLQARYRQALNRYNRALKTLARNVHVRENISSYVPRHTWASLAYGMGVSMPVISEAMGHRDVHTTAIYIRPMGDGKIEKANRKILGRINAGFASAGDAHIQDDTSCQEVAGSSRCYCLPCHPLSCAGRECHDS